MLFYKLLFFHELPRYQKEGWKNVLMLFYKLLLFHEGGKGGIMHITLC